MSPFRSSRATLPVKRLWMQLVRQDNLKDIFLRYVYRKRKEPDNSEVCAALTNLFLHHHHHCYCRCHHHKSLLLPQLQQELLPLPPPPPLLFFILDHDWHKWPPSKCLFPPFAFTWHLSMLVEIVKVLLNSQIACKHNLRVTLTIIVNWHIEEKFWISNNSTYPYNYS